MNIPPPQNLPPAGLENVLAYRPACSQVVSAGDGQQTRHYVTRGDGVEITLATLRTMPQQDALKTLGDWGLCKSKGEIVPLVEPGHLLTNIGRPTVNNTPKPTHFSGGAIALLAIVGAIAAITLYTLRNRPNNPINRFIQGGS